MKKFNTEEEIKAFECGVDYTKGYIAFCIKHHKCEAEEFRDLILEKDILDFIVLGKGIIPNKYNISFEEFCENYEKYRLES